MLNALLLLATATVPEALGIMLIWLTVFFIGTLIMDACDRTEK